MRQERIHRDAGRRPAIGAINNAQSNRR